MHPFKLRLYTFLKYLHITLKLIPGGSEKGALTEVVISLDTVGAMQDCLDEVKRFLFIFTAFYG